MRRQAKIHEIHASRTRRMLTAGLLAASLALGGCTGAPGAGGGADTGMTIENGAGGASNGGRTTENGNSGASSGGIGGTNVMNLTTGLVAGASFASDDRDANARAAADAVKAFAWKLCGEVLAENGTGNAMISPLSVHLALDMALNGAGGETAAEMQRALAAEGISLDALNEGMRIWLSESTAEGEARWSVANAIWVDRRYSVSKSFLQNGALNYGADAFTLDFTAPSSLDAINGWVSDRTNGKIDRILDRIGDDVRMYLVNAVWFKADWQNPFTKESTVPSTFHAPTGDIQTPFMNRSGQMTVLAGKGAAASKMQLGIVLPYTDERFSFVALLPADGTNARELATALTPADFEAMLAGGATEQVDLSMPKFETRFETDLVGAMQALGMKAAFDPAAADFSGMSAEGAGDLFISAVRHKTYIRVDEAGTEAAAATSVEMSLTSMPMESRRIVLDRPYLYAVVDKTGIPLFIGVMENMAQ